MEFYLKGTLNRIRVQVTDEEHKMWIYLIIPTSNWKKYKIPFSDFKYRGDWQVSGTPKNTNFKLDKVYDFQIIHTVDDQDADGVIWLDDVRFYK